MNELEISIIYLIIKQYEKHQYKLIDSYIEFFFRTLPPDQRFSKISIDDSKCEEK